jgi:nicotinamidase-related amidase
MPVTALDPRTALVVIDLQRGIGKLPTLRPFAEIVANSARLADGFRAAALPVVLVTVGFSADGVDRLTPRAEVPARTLPSDPEFVALVPELGPKAGDILITKRQWSAFYGTELDLQLRRRGVTGIVLTGVSTSIGVDSSARAANERGYNLSFASDAITDLDPAAHEHAMTKIFPRIGEIGTSEALLGLLAGRAAAPPRRT